MTQPDSIIPDQDNPLDWNRYAYARYNPVNNTDPTGHMVDDGTKSGSANKWELYPLNPVVLGPSKPPTILYGQPGPILKQGEGRSPYITTISAWEPPKKWDTNPKSPDYWAVSITGGPPTSPAGGAVVITRDRYGNYYIAPGVTAGKSLFAFSASVTYGCIPSCSDTTFPDETNMEQFLSGFSGNGSLGWAKGVGVTWSPFAGEFVHHWGYEQGGYTPSLGVIVVYGFKITP